MEETAKKIDVRQSQSPAYQIYVANYVCLFRTDGSKIVYSVHASVEHQINEE